MSSATHCSAHSDVFLANVNGQTVIGGANELATANENYDLTTRVFTGVMIPEFPPFAPLDYGRDEPGFVALGAGNLNIPSGASALPGNASVTMHFPSFTVGSQSHSLFYWDGSGAVDFQPISPGQPDVAFAFDPNPIANTNSDGSLHEHAVFTLHDGDTGVLPADGVYLISPYASVAGLTDSNPFYMLFLVDALITGEEDAETLEEALESEDPVFAGKNFGFFIDATSYVNENLAVPEPGSVVLIGAACAFFAARTMRQRNGNRRRG